MARKASTIENRVYVFTPLATELVSQLAERFADPGAKAGIRAALAEIARVACIVADSDALSPEEVAARVREPGD